MKAKLPRKPRPEAAPDPRGGAVYVVRYVDSRGDTCSTFFVKRASADRFQAWVNRCGGHANVWATTTEWRLMG